MRLLVFLVACVSILPGQTTTAPATRPGAPKIPADTEIKTTPSGLKYSVLKEGFAEGRIPKATDKVWVHYTGWLADGTLFDSSVNRGKPAEFNVTGVIKGWTEGLQLMRQGAKYKFTIPPELAYGAQGRPGIPPNSTLIFEVELLAVTDAPPPPTPLPIPDFLPVVDSLMLTTPSGIKYRVLLEGTGETPAAGSWAQIHFASWLTDGTLVKATYPSGLPQRELVGKSIVKGWNEALPMMKQGSVYQFVIPPELAFGNRKMGNIPPNSPLVFRIEMVKASATPPDPRMK